MGHQTLKSKTGKTKKQKQIFLKIYVAGTILCGILNTQTKKQEKPPKQPTKFTNFHTVDTKSTWDIKPSNLKQEKPPKYTTKFTKFYVLGKNLCGMSNPQTKNRKNLQNNQPSSQTFTLEVKI